MRFFRGGEPRVRKTLIGLNLAVFIMMLGVGMVMPLLPNRIVAFTGSDAAVGYIASAFAVSYIVLQLPMGALSDRLGFKTFLVAGYLLCALSGLLYYLARGTALVFLGRAIQGAGEAPLWALAPALLSIHYPEAKGKVMGIYNATLHVGLTFGPLLGIVALKFSLNDLAFPFFSVVCVAAAAIVWFSVENPCQPAQPGRAIGRNAIDVGKILSLASDRRILATLVGITLYGAGYGVFITTIPAFFLSAKGYGQTFVQIFFACFYLAISAAQLTAGPASDRWGRERFMIGGLGLAALFVGLFPGMGRAASIAVLAAASLGLGTFFLSSMAFLNEAAPASLKGTISGAYYLFWGIGYFAGAPLVGKLGFTAFAAALAVETAVMVCLMGRNRKKC